MLQNEHVKHQLLLPSLLAKQNTIVRQTIRIAVRKRTRHHGQIQVRNEVFKIVFSLRKNRGGNWGQQKTIRLVTKNESGDAPKATREHR